MRLILSFFTVAWLVLFGQSRIVGGTVLDTKDFKAFDFVVGIGALQEYQGKSFVIPTCTGTLLNETWVLTAGHCLVLEDMYVYGQTGRLFDEKFSTNYEQGKTVKVAQIFYPKDFKLTELFGEIISVRHDVALLQLEEPLKATIYPKIPTLNTINDLIAKTKSNAFDLVGWGVKENNAQTLYARHVKVDVYDQVQCKKIYQSTKTSRAFKATVGNSDAKVNLDLAKEFDPNAICAGGLDRGFNFAGACFGDSGGGLYYKKDDEVWVLGVVSSGAGGVCGYYPAILMNLGHYRSYLQDTIKTPLQSVVRKDILRKGYIKSLPKGVHMLGTERILDHKSDLFEGVKLVLMYEKNKWRSIEIVDGRLPKGVRIAPKTGFWIKK